MPRKGLVEVPQQLPGLVPREAGQQEGREALRSDHAGVHEHPVWRREHPPRRHLVAVEEEFLQQRQPDALSNAMNTINAATVSKTTPARQPLRSAPCLPATAATATAANADFSRYLLPPQRTCVCVWGGGGGGGGVRLLVKGSEEKRGEGLAIEGREGKRQEDKTRQET